MAKSRATTVFPIKRCMPEILLAIFQALIDDETFMHSQTWEKNASGWWRPVETVKLSLVCRQWKDLVYSTRSLWNVISLDSSLLDKIPTSIIPLGPTERAAQLFQDAHWRVKMAKGAPIYLFIYKFDANKEEKTAMSSVLGIAPNLRGLYAEINSTDRIGPFHLLKRAWPELYELREAAYSIEISPRRRLDLSAHLSGMPNLVRLWLTTEGLKLPHCTGDPLLPRLKILRLGGRPTGTRQSFAHVVDPDFLSHCPRLEELHIHSLPWSGLSNETIEPTQVHLPYLRVVTTSSVFVLRPFIDGIITTGALEEVALLYWTDGNTKYGSTLLSNHAQSIKRLRLTGSDKVHDPHLLSPLDHLQSLVLCDVHDRGAFLAPLSSLILPSLRTITLELYKPLLGEFFSKLATARCIPVNRERITAAGVPSLDNLRIVTTDPEYQLEEVMSSREWQRATISEGPPDVFELCWEFEGT